MANNIITAGLQITANVDGIQEINNLSQAVDDASEQVQEMQRIAAAKTTLGLDVDDHARAEIQKLDKAFDDLKRSGGLSQAELARAAQLHAQKVGELEQSLKRTKPSLADMTNGIQGLVGAGGGLAYVTNEAIKFESAMAQVKKVTDATPEQINALSGSLKEMAGQLGMMPDELAQIAAAGGQMGLAFDKLQQFTQMTAQMANAFGISADAAGEMSAKISNVYGLQINEMAELGDAINALGNTTAAKEKEIGEVLMRMGGNAKQFGLLKEEAAALAATFVSLGKSPEEAGTAINALLSKLQNAKIGTNDFKDGLNALGLSAEEMAANIAANPQRALDDFLQRLDKLDKQARSEILGQMFGAEYSDDLALLTGSLKTYTEAVATATDHTKNFGAMQREADAALNTTEGKMNQAKAEIASAAIELGNALLPIIQLTANVIGDVAKAVTSVSEQYPVLSQMAVLFLGAKVAASGLQTALKLVGVESTASLFKTKLSVDGVCQSITQTATAAKLMSKDLAVAFRTRDVAALSTHLASAAQNAMAMWAAFEVGHGVGTWLREQSTLVRDFGDEISRAIAYADALNPFSERKLSDVKKYFQTTKELQAEQKELEKQAAAVAAIRDAENKKASAEQSQYIEQLTAQYRQYQKQLNATDTTLKQLENSGDTDIAMHQRMIEQKTKLEEQTAKLRVELGKFHANLDDTSPLAKNRQALLDLGLSVEQMATGIGKNAQSSLDNFKLAVQTFGNDSKQMSAIFQAALKDMDSPEALSALKQNLAEAGKKAGLTAEQISQIAATAPQAGLNLAAISKSLGDAEAAATTLGISLESALTGSTPAFQAALANFGAIRSQLDGLAENGVNVGVVFQQAFAKLTENAQTKADIEALKAQIQSLGEAGKLSATEMADALLAADVKMAHIAEATSPVSVAFKEMGVQSRDAIELQIRQAENALQTMQQSGQATESALNQVKNKIQELKNELDPTAQAFDRLGIKTKEALAAASAQQMADFEKVRQSGQATQADLAKAFAQTAQAALASGDAQQQAWVQSQAAAYNYAVTVDATGKASLQAAAQTQQAADTQIQAHQQVTQAATESAQAQSQAAKAAVENVENVGKAAESSQHKMSDLGSKVHETLKKMGAYATFGTASWANTLRSVQDMYININQTVQRLNEETENGGNIAEHLARTELMAANNARKLDKTTLSNLHQAIDKARQKMQQLADEAANARKEAEKELLRAQGRDGDVQKLEQQEKLNALKRKQAQAQKIGNRQAQDDYAAAIAAQQAAYQAQAEREAEQQQREAEQERERQQQQREAEQQRLQQQRQAEQQRQQQKTAINTSSNVQISMDTDDIVAQLAARDERVAQGAVDSLMQQLQQAIAAQR